MTHPTDGGGGLLGLGRGLPPNDFMAQHESPPSSEASCLKNVSSLNGFCFMTLGGREEGGGGGYGDETITMPPPSVQSSSKK